MHADIGSDPAQHDMRHAARTEYVFQIGGEKGALTGFIDNDLAVDRSQLGDDFPARLATDENSASRTLLANTRADTHATPEFIGRQIDELGTVSLARMNHHYTGHAAHQS